MAACSFCSTGRLAAKLDAPVAAEEIGEAGFTQSVIGTTLEGEEKLADEVEGRLIQLKAEVAGVGKENTEAEG